MKIRVLPFATARDAVGASEGEVELAEGDHLDDLARRLQTDFPALRTIWPRLAIAVDGQIAEPSAVLSDGAEVALLPPVSGGAGHRTEIVDSSIDIAAAADAVTSGDCGATALFVGTVRNHHRGREVTKILYDAYRPMAGAALEKIAEELERNEDARRVHIVHRLGELGVGESSVVIAVSSSHREAAFRICRLALERLKREVPIWKREFYAGGASVWREEEPLARSPEPVTGRGEPA